MPNNPAPQHADIRAEARRWFLVMQDNPSRFQRAACEKWRRSHPAHEEAWNAIESVWQDTAAPGMQLAEQEADVLAGYLAAMDHNRDRQQRRRRFASAGAVCILLLMVAGVWLQNPSWIENLSADHVSVRGERSSVLLADGSKVLLDADSAISVAMSAETRRVHLLRGGAYFDVTPSKTPFIVETSAGNVRVLGTQFDVRLQQDNAVVTLARGSVAVRSNEQSTPTIIKPGQQVTFSRNGVDVPAQTNIADAMAWHSGRYIFYRARLADVVSEIERYRHGRVIIPSAELAEERVTGSFSLTDTDKALDSLQASVGFSMRKVSEYLVIISK
ncbi:Iron siderophore sensor protein [Pantoea sp. AS-PWVM4]|uniref:FecR family protein n=1 Tax=Pantoea sp. AS-PWVM4 TaxID=1332069 RepID=UPI0003AC88CE|nr:FecR family protein [Pantoea sp. AS-PWVM4]ERK06171.1 Iron siderophore sensor protein [Pantoea sp. AS-PWVM4]